MLRRYRAINLGFAALIAGALTLAVAAALVSSLLSYDGRCSGFTDGSAPCPWREYAAGQMFYALLLAMVPLAGLGGLWGGYAAAVAVYRATADQLRHAQRVAAGAAAALLGCAGGVLATGVAMTLLMTLAGSLGGSQAALR